MVCYRMRGSLGFNQSNLIILFLILLFCQQYFRMIYLNMAIGGHFENKIKVNIVYGKKYK